MTRFTLSAKRLMREHRPFAVVLGLAVLVRVGVAIAYGPALFYSDSWTYLELAYAGDLVGVTWDRPSGYPLLMHLLAPGRDLLTVTALQHLAGLAAGVILYTLLLRLGAGRMVAALGTAVVVLDGYAVALEQHLLPEAFFTFLVVAAMLVAVEARWGARSFALAGGLLGVAATMRSVALLVIPLLLLYLVWRHGRLRAAAPALAAALVPLLMFAALQSHQGGGFGLGGANGWFLYGRVAEIADCRGLQVPAATRALCDRTAEDSRKGPGYHMWSKRSPARRMFGGMGPDWVGQERSNRLLDAHAKTVIRERPLEYASLAAGDFIRFFRPGQASPGSSDLALELPALPRSRFFRADLRDRYVPGYNPEVRAPSTIVRAYRDAVHTPRWLLAALTLVALATLTAALGRRWRARLDHLPEIVLFTGAGLVMLAAPAVTSDFVLRYVVPVSPLLVAGGLVAMSDVWRARRAAESSAEGRRAQRVPAPTYSGTAARRRLPALSGDRPSP